MCDFHKNNYINKYSSRYTFCCNPFETHKIKFLYQCSKVNLECALKCTKYSIKNIIPGKKICKNCLTLLNTKLKEAEQTAEFLDTEELQSQNANMCSENTIKYIKYIKYIK